MSERVLTILSQGLFLGGSILLLAGTVLNLYNTLVNR